MTKQLIKFCETFYKSRNLLLNILLTDGSTYLEPQADGSTYINLGKDLDSLYDRLSLIYKGDGLTFNYKKAESRGPWKVTFYSDGISIEKSKEDLSKDIYMTIHNGRITKFFVSNFPEEASIPLIGQERVLNDVVDLLKHSIPMVEAAMAEHEYNEYKLKATPIIHSFFKEINTDSVPSIDKGVEELILSYL